MIGRLLSANARAKSKKLLISNRGEIAIRIARAASELGLKTIGITTKDDIDSLHNTKVDEVIMLPSKLYNFFKTI
jgi:pyruvate carboxylase